MIGRARQDSRTRVPDHLPLSDPVFNPKGRRWTVQQETAVMYDNQTKNKALYSALLASNALAWTPLLAWWWYLIAIPNGFFLEGQKAFKQAG